MKIIQTIKGKARHILSNTSLFKKLMYIYIIIIFIPVAAFSFYIYKLSEDSINGKFVESCEEMLEQAKNNMDTNILFVENIANRIAYNSDIQEFLEKTRELSWDEIYEFQDKIAPLISSIKEISEVRIDSLSIYYTNHNIPEIWYYFLEEERIEENKWYISFRDSGATEVWVLTRNTDMLSLEQLAGQNNTFSFIKKMNYIYNSDYLGIVCVNISQEDFLIQFSQTAGYDEFYFLVTPDGELISAQMTDAEAPEDSLVMECIETNSRVLKNGWLIIPEQIDSLGMTLVYAKNVSDLTHDMRARSIMIFVFVFACFILCVVITYLVLKRVYNNLFRIMEVMDEAVKGNTSIRIEEKRSDEVGIVIDYFNSLIERINTLVCESVNREISQREAQIAALQYQINPHFLYNTLEIFRMKVLMLKDPQTAEAMVDFGKMLRYNLSHEHDFATIGQEIEQVEKYINIQRLVYQDRISFTCVVPKRISKIKVLRFILQPLVENCVQHGLDGSMNDLHISVAFREDGKDLYIEIKDTGVGIDRRVLDELNQSFINSEGKISLHLGQEGIGLKNVNDRLKIHYGNDCFLHFESEPGKYTKVCFTIPLTGEAAGG